MEIRDILRNYHNVKLLNKSRRDDDTKCINDYVVIQTINKGQYSKVILCIREEKFYILKKYNLKWLEKKKHFVKSVNNEMKIRSKLDDLKDELEILIHLNNPYCLGCNEIITDYEKKIYIQNKYYENESILKYDEFFYVLQKEELFFIPIPVIKCIIKSLLKALNYIHKTKKICHRDIKPLNILLSRKGEVILSDFGEAQYMTGKVIRGTKGTYEFMPPEFFTKQKFYDGEKTDMWSLGISLYAMFYRVVPFKRISSLLQLFDDIIQKDIPYVKNRSHFLFLQIKSLSDKRKNGDDDDDDKDSLNEQEKETESVEEKDTESEEEKYTECEEEKYTEIEEEKYTDIEDEKVENIETKKEKEKEEEIEEIEEIEIEEEKGNENKIKGEIEYEKELSDEDINFLKKLLNKSPLKRYSSDEALNDSWLNDVDYKNLEEYAERIYKMKQHLNILNR